MRGFSIILLFLLFSKAALSQNSVAEDSLLGVLKNATTNKQKSAALNALSFELSAKDPDTALFFAKQALEFAQRESDLKLISSAYFNKGNCYDYLFSLDSAMLYYSKYLELGKKMKDSTIISHGYNVVGSVHIYLGDYSKALQNCMQSLKIAEARKDLKNIGKAANNIGNIFYFQNKKELGLSYWKKALDINLKLNNKANAAIILSNIGAYYNDNGDYNNALVYLNQALKIQDELGNLTGKANTLTNIGLASHDQKKYKEALDYFHQALAISDELNDDFAKISEYNNIGFSNYQLMNYKDAIKSFLISDSICIKHNSPDGRKSSLAGLSQSFEMIGDYKNAYTYHKLLAQVSDSLLNAESTQQVAELETKYQTEKKETENKLLQTENVLSTKTIKQQRTITYFIIGGFIIVSLLAFFIFKGLKTQKKANEIISNQKLLVEYQKHLVEEKHKEITDSINYAERIQRSFLATKQLLDENLNEYFVLFKPKDVVSGDFYWVAKLYNDQFALVTADSTGHGVPGAIMSLLNITSLEKAIESYIKPSDILNSTRKTIIERLKKDGSAEGGKDGMDCSLCLYDFKNKKLHIAAANNPVWIVRRNPAPFSLEEGQRDETEVIEIKPDKMPVGKHDRDTISFTQQEIDLQTGDVVYTLTDGFPDQFGGEKGKKFMSKNLRELLAANAHLPMQEQKVLLEKTFASWVGNMEQVDDVCIIGIRL